MSDMDSSMIILKTDEEIEFMREANRLVGKTLGELSKHINRSNYATTR